MAWLRAASWCLVLLAGCAHSALSGDELDHLGKVAFVARLEPGAGPHSSVFRDEGSRYAEWLKKMGIAEAKEGDQRLEYTLLKGTSSAPSITPFEIADSLRAETLARLPHEAPWMSMVSAVDVASALESFLVQDVGAGAPDFARLKPLGAEVVVELVIEQFGMRSAEGRAGLFLYGRARAFRIDGGELYHRRFFSDEVSAGLEPLDPTDVAKNPNLYRERMRQLLASIADVLAADLNPRAPRPAAEAPAPGP